jgi:hypothetical protein
MADALSIQLRVSAIPVLDFSFTIEVIFVV